MSTNAYHILQIPVPLLCLVGRDSTVLNTCSTKILFPKRRCIVEVLHQLKKIRKNVYNYKICKIVKSYYCIKLICSHNEHAKIKRPPIRHLLARGGPRGKMAWQEYIVKTINHIVQFNNQSTKALNSSIQTAAKNIMEFEKNLILVSKNLSLTSIVE